MSATEATHVTRGRMSNDEAIADLGFVRTSHTGFHATVGRMNVHPSIEVSGPLRGRLSRWKTPDGTVMGVTISDPNGIIPTAHGVRKESL